MTYVFLGLIVLVISFLIALLTLIREQRQMERERDALEGQPPQVPSVSEVERTEVPTPLIHGESLADNFQNPQKSDAGEPYPWDQKPQETVVPPSVDVVSGETKGDGNGNLIRGGEFIVPRSVPDKE